MIDINTLPQIGLIAHTPTRYAMLLLYRDTIIKLLVTTKKQIVANHLGIPYPYFTTWLNSVAPYPINTPLSTIAKDTLLTYAKESKDTSELLQGLLND